MVLSGVYLPNRSAYAWPVLADHDEQILGDEPESLVRLDYLDMCESLSICTHLILTLNNQHTTFAQHSIGFFTCLFVQIQHGFMVFLVRPVPGTVIAIVSFECGMDRVGGPTRRVHVRWVKDYAIYRCVFIGELPTINPRLNIRRKQFVASRWYVSPENAHPEGNVGNYASRSDVKIQNMRKRVFVPAQVSAED